MNRNTQAMTPTAKAGWGPVIAGGEAQVRLVDDCALSLFRIPQARFSS